MTSHQLLMEAVGKFWSQLSGVQGPGVEMIPLPEYRCELLPFQEQFLRFGEVAIRAALASAAVPTIGVYEMLRRASAAAPANQEPLSLPRLFESLYEIKRINDGVSSNMFTVFLPPDERMSPFATKQGHSFDERNIAWWATKRRIDLHRIRNIHWERNQCVFDVMLPANENAERSFDRSALRTTPHQAPP